MVFQRQKRKGKTIVGRCCFINGEMWRILEPWKWENGERLLNRDRGKWCGVADSGVLAMGKVKNSLNSGVSAMKKEQSVVDSGVSTMGRMVKGC
jgi:hypothetical protein